MLASIRICDKNHIKFPPKTREFVSQNSTCNVWQSASDHSPALLWKCVSSYLYCEYHKCLRDCDVAQNWRCAVWIWFWTRGLALQMLRWKFIHSDEWEHLLFQTIFKIVQTYSRHYTAFWEYSLTISQSLKWPHVWLDKKSVCKSCRALN